MSDDLNFDRRVRLAAFQWLAEQVKIHGEVLPRVLLQRGFEFSGERIPLVSPRGIFIPKRLNYPLSITTSPDSPYQDRITDTDFILYKYCGDNPMHRDNAGLREAMRLRLPLVYFRGIVPGKYFTAWPVYVISDSPGTLEFTVAVDEAEAVEDVRRTKQVADEGNAKKAYITRATLHRVHQRSFRERVLRAYREQCALCRLRHKTLLDAAHIIPDAEESSTASVDNGISLCKLHHAAFDQFLIGIRPDFKVEVKEKILEEKDGPMLQHGLKELHGISIILPRDKAAWPNRDALDSKYNEFMRTD